MCAQFQRFAMWILYSHLFGSFNISKHLRWKKKKKSPNASKNSTLANNKKKPLFSSKYNLWNNDSVSFLLQPLLVLTITLKDARNYKKRKRPFVAAGWTHAIEDIERKKGEEKVNAPLEAVDSQPATSAQVYIIVARKRERCMLEIYSETLRAS